ncbi:protein-disulfide reductase DsbD domain-containing protein [Phyllobacterium sp. YR531]|uniref:protein-disulfide reductase DsbD domain-containing protein n=1 Tax=Phyllobacterium sp. YR531 TaxID=1144343 RepID=UPI00026F993B|nr:protein-disulfide reductase DsbD domain-containing protein [Phyllobacterium sp. YR531]EJM98494.1 protein involved in C-type cytochrome biogenesis [Phyllobacterium sp. YR531]
MKFKLFIFLVTLAAAAPAHAGNSEWTKTPGGSVRLVVDKTPSHANEIRGVVQINLDPGWKTYWREPGDAGVPPELNIDGSTNVKNAVLAFPAPHRFDDGGMHWAGYKKPVSLPVTFTLVDPNQSTRLKGHAFLGICETICIPVTAEFDIPLGQAQSDPLSKTLVDTAFEELPSSASAIFGAASATKDGDDIKFVVNLPADDPDTDVFVAGNGTTAYGMAKLEKRDAKSAVFSVPVTSGSQEKFTTLNYTLVQGKQAVSGTIDVRE